MARCFSRLTLEATSYPPFFADFHTDPPVEAFQHFECASDAKVARVIGVACVHDPRSSRVGHVDANGVVKGYTASATAELGAVAMCGLGAVTMRGGVGRLSGIVEPRRASAEAVTSESWPSEEAMERWTRRIHFGRPCGNQAVRRCFLSGLPFDFACA